MIQQNNRINSLDEAILFMESDHGCFANAEELFQDAYRDGGSFGAAYSFENKILKVHYDDLSFVSDATQ